MSRKPKESTETVESVDPRSTFRVEYVEQARKLAAKGWIDAEIAEFFEIGVRTLYRWRKYSAAFDEAMGEGKSRANAIVQESLYRSANGFEYPEEKIFCYEGQIVRAESMRYIPPSVKAQQYWLNNRDPEKFATKQEFTGANGSKLHPVTETAARPKRTTIEIARRTLYVLQRAQDQALLGGPEGGEDGGQMTKVVEERMTQTTEE